MIMGRAGEWAGLGRVGASQLLNVYQVLLVGIASTLKSQNAWCANHCRDGVSHNAHRYWVGANSTVTRPSVGIVQRTNIYRQIMLCADAVGLRGRM